MGTTEAFRLDGRVAVVTGGLGRIGSAIAEALAGAGARLVVLDRAADRWTEVGPLFGAQAQFELCDVTTLEAIPAVVADVDSRFGGVSVWVNCAYPRAGGSGGKPEDDTVESWRLNVDMQMTSACLFADQAARCMAARGKGSIINIASIYGIVAPDFAIYEGTDITTSPVYAAVKGGLIAHTRYLASYYGRRGVRVNALCPGGVAAGQPAAFVEAYSRRTALGRMAEAGELGPPALFLASDASSYVTGAVLMVDGGWTAL